MPVSMQPFEIAQFRRRMAEEPTVHGARQQFHENYELLEAYWRQRGCTFDAFCREVANSIWQDKDVRNEAHWFASQECVGNSRHPDFLQSAEIAKATMHLRYYSGMSQGGSAIDCQTIGCRSDKVDQGMCTEHRAKKWPKDSRGHFRALMFILRQLRNNMFHGMKVQLADPQFQRNADLLVHAARATDAILRYLEQP